MHTLIISCTTEMRCKHFRAQIEDEQEIVLEAKGMSKNEVKKLQIKELSREMGSNGKPKIRMLGRH